MLAVHQYSGRRALDVFLSRVFLHYILQSDTETHADTLTLRQILA